MARQIQLRQGLASDWTTVNPVLAEAEIGVETDTGRFKLGNLVDDWATRPYADIQGPIQNIARKSLGDGSDGDVVISSGITVLQRDMYYNNLTINGTGSIFVNGYKIFVKEILDLANAPKDAINANGDPGNDAVANVAGASMPAYIAGSTGLQGRGTNGSTGVTGAGVASSAVVNLTGNGGASNSPGNGGAGTNAGVSGSGGGTPSHQDINNYFTQLLRGVTLLSGGVAGRGGASGGGDGTNPGGGGGAGGNGGGVVALYVGRILTSSNTASSAISARGGDAGNGGTPTVGICGGGGGGAGGAGGWVYIAYNRKFGPDVPDLIDVSGGRGGRGGNGFGTIVSSGLPAQGGGSGSGGYPGRITLYRITTAEGVTAFGVTATYYAPRVVIPSTAQVDGIGKNGGEPGRLLLKF